VSQTFKAINVESDSGVSKLKSHSSHHHHHSSSSSISDIDNLDEDGLLTGESATAVAAAANLGNAAIIQTVGDIDCDIAALGTATAATVCAACPGP
jgi:hypothetical protein